MPCHIVFSRDRCSNDAKAVLFFWFYSEMSSGLFKEVPARALDLRPGSFLQNILLNNELFCRVMNKNKYNNCSVSGWRGEKL